MAPDSERQLLLSTPSPFPPPPPSLLRPVAMATLQKQQQHQHYPKNSTINIGTWGRCEDTYAAPFAVLAPLPLPLAPLTRAAEIA